MLSLRYVPASLAVGLRKISLRQALPLLASAIAWLQPPPVLPLPSRTGPDGPPRPFGFMPPVGAAAPHTAATLQRAQNHALLYGPFPRGGLQRGVSDGTLLLNENAGVRALADARVRAAGASVARIPVDWRDTVEEAPPADFQARNPASPAYRFALLDAAVRSATAAGLQPLLVVSHAPAFAEAPHRWSYAYRGSWAPSPAALEAFAAALARRYDGSFPDPLHPGAMLPRVKLMQAWNEPNLSRYLEPQWVVAHGRWSAFSPLLYRQLLNGFYAGVKSVVSTDTVVAAGIAPEGEPTGQGVMSPVPFLEGLLCLSPAGCADRPRFDVLAFHPLSVYDPDVPAASALDVSISDIAKVTTLLAEAERRHTVLPAAPKPLWVTELNWDSAGSSGDRDPSGVRATSTGDRTTLEVGAGSSGDRDPSGVRATSSGDSATSSPHGSAPSVRGGVPPRLQAAWIARALHRLWVAGVSLVDWQFLVDPYPGVPLAGPTGRLTYYPRPAGLYYAGVSDGHADPARARAKPFLRGFELPFDPLRVNRRQVRIWALLTHPGQPVVLQRQGFGGRWWTIAHLRGDRYGVLNVLKALRGTASLRVKTGALASAAMAVPQS
jgi:hypothetical protein